MMLAGLAMSRPGELRADFQQFYGIDLERALSLGEHSVRHLCALCRHLPRESRIVRASSEDAAWSLEATMGAAVFNQLASMAYGLGGAKGEEPKYAGPSWMREGGGRKLPAKVMSIAELERQLARFENIDMKEV